MFDSRRDSLQATNTEPRVCVCVSCMPANARTVYISGLVERERCICAATELIELEMGAFESKLARSSRHRNDSDRICVSVVRNWHAQCHTLTATLTTTLSLPHSHYHAQCHVLVSLRQCVHKAVPVCTRFALSSR